MLLLCCRPDLFDELVLKVARDAVFELARDPTLDPRDLVGESSLDSVVLDLPLVDIDLECRPDLVDKLVLKVARDAVFEPARDPTLDSRDLVGESSLDSVVIDLPLVDIDLETSKFRTCLDPGRLRPRISRLWGCWKIFLSSL